ncbi:MAG: hypothetical protein O6761_05810 [Thaumarchaeota archaeon]|nr:hypothetical protein [Nitrososphaerota archaeon]
MNGLVMLAIATIMVSSFVPVMAQSSDFGINASVPQPDSHGDQQYCDELLKIISDGRPFYAEESQNQYDEHCS